MEGYKIGLWGKRKTDIGNWELEMDFRSHYPSALNFLYDRKLKM
jgi:hypothetical protein